MDLNLKFQIFFLKEKKMERSRGNVNYKCSRLVVCTTQDMGNSRPLCPEDSNMCPYNPNSALYKFLNGLE